MKKYIKINSDVLGVSVGFLSFYVLFYSIEISWEISFAIAFTLGYLASKFLDIYAGKITQDELDSYEAKQVSKAIDDFEQNG